MQVDTSNWANYTDLVMKIHTDLKGGGKQISQGKISHHPQAELGSFYKPLVAHLITCWIPEQT